MHCFSSFLLMMSVFLPLTSSPSYQVFISVTVDIYWSYPVFKYEVRIDGVNCSPFTFASPVPFCVYFPLRTAFSLASIASCSPSSFSSILNLSFSLHSPIDSSFHSCIYPYIMHLLRQTSLWIYDIFIPLTVRWSIAQTRARRIEGV